MIRMKEYSESYIEDCFVKMIEKKGGEAFKMHPISLQGLPDRLVHLDGVTFYVELKATGEEPTPIQCEMHRRIAKTGIRTYILDKPVFTYSEFCLLRNISCRLPGEYYHK